MKQRTFYAVQNDNDYEGGGITAVFSTLKKAVAHYEDNEKNYGDDISVVKIRIDEPDFAEILYERRRK